ncbi:MAG: HAMP domain-containing sensor histidine kinase [Pseudomonadota bacterium]
MNRLSGFLRLSAVRQTLSLLALFSLISVVAWGGTYWLVQREMLRTVDSRLEGRLQAAVAALSAGAPMPPPGDGQTAEIIGPEARSQEPFRARDGFFTRDLRPGGIEMRYLLRTTEQGRILLGENTERQEELRDILAAGMQLSLLSTLLVTALAGAWMARRGQTRLNTISQGLANVARGHFDTRISLEGQDDLSLLADRINATTERLDEAMTQMRVQASNIAHDLRTPLARLRAEIESRLGEAANLDQPVSPEMLAGALDQIDQITGTFDALLRLARIESGAGREAFSRIELGALVGEVRDIFGPVIEDAGQTLEVVVQQAEPVHGDRDLLVQLLANLIQNALRYGAEGQTVRLQAFGRRLSVSDEGPGIPVAEREIVLQPLYQGEASRQGLGAGLGLSLVNAIATLHGAELSLADGPHGRGLTVKVHFPPQAET